MLHHELTRALAAVGADIDGAECHGILCGMLASGAPFSPAQWLEHAAGRSDLTPFGPEGSGHVVWQVLRETWAAFDGGEFGLDLVLPDDAADIAERAGALVFWSRGFLSGFGMGGAKTYGALDEDARGFLEDLTRIARLDTEIGGDEENERILAELTEFLRLGALMLFEQTLPAEDSTEHPAGDSTAPLIDDEQPPQTLPVRTLH